jgi:pilus assembly protein FimV
MRVRPILTIGLIAGVLMLSGSALALGLGKLTVLSSLGQPLSARIELTSATKEELDSLAAKVADPSLYRQNNLAYQGVLARSRVTLERSPSGQAALIVTTQGALNEPYLDLMVELNWASGRLVREYTFLLDPPGAAPPPVEPVAPVRSGVAPPRSAPVAAAPAGAAPAPASAPAAVPSATAPRGTVKVKAIP